MIKMTTAVRMGSSHEGQDASWIGYRLYCSCGCGNRVDIQYAASQVRGKYESFIGCYWKSRMLPGEDWE